MMRLVILAFFLTLANLASCGQTQNQAPEYKKFATDAEVPRIVIEDAKKAFDDNSAVFVDARSLDQYKLEHIKGAIDVPYGAPDSEVEKVPKGKKIIVYCT
jgi:predicted sulfurtransferase